MCSVLLIHAIAIAATSSAMQQQSTAAAVINNGQRSRKAVSQSPITYVQLFDSDNGGKSAITRPKRTKSKKNDKPKNQMTNHELLTSLGLGKLQTPSNPHRKRLATQSRHVGRPDDSRVFIVKLPPNPYYYDAPSNSYKSQPSANELNSIDDKNKKVSELHLRRKTYDFHNPTTGDSRWLQVERQAGPNLPLEHSLFDQNAGWIGRPKQQQKVQGEESQFAS